MFTIGQQSGMALVLALSLPAAGAEPVRTDRYGDALPPGAVARLGSVRFRAPYKDFSAVAFAPDGKALAALGRGGVGVSLWDLATGRIVRQFELPSVQGKSQSPYDVHAFLAFSPDGKTLLAGTNASTGCRPLSLWDVATGKEVCRMEGANEGFIAAAVSADFRTLAASGKDRPIRFWEVATGKRLRQAPDLEGEVLSLAFSPDGKVLASGGEDKLIRLWDVASAKEVGRLEGHKGPVGALAFAPDGKVLASADRERRFVLWDVARGKPLHQWDAEPNKGRGPLENGIYALAFAPDGQALAACDRGWALDLWEVPSGKKRHGWRGNINHFCAFSPDGKVLAAAGDLAISLWSTATGQPLYAGHDRQANAVTFSADGATLITIGGNKVHWWDPAKGELRDTLHMDHPPVLSRDGKLVVDRDWEGKVIYLKETVSGKELRTLKPVGPSAHPLRLSPDGKTLAGTDGPGPFPLVLWDLAAGKKLHQLEANKNFLVEFDFSPDGQIFADVVGESNRCRLWDVASGKLLHEIPLEDRCYRLAFSPDGRLMASCNWSSTIRLWEVATGRKVRQWTASQQYVSQVAFSADGRTLASADRPGQGTGDACIQLWDVDTGKELHRTEGHARGHINALAFSPDSKRLASGSGTDGTVLIWDVARFVLREAPAAGKLNVGELKDLWSGLAGPDAAKAHQAVQALARAPQDALPFLAARLAERPPPVEAKRLARLIADLDDEEFAVREKATQELIKLGRTAARALGERLRDDKVSAEARRRIEQVLEAFVRGKDVPPELLVWLRATEVLERLGTPEARKLLGELAAGVGPVPEQAQAALGRLGGR